MRAAIGSDPTFTPSEFVAVFNQAVEMMFPSVAIIGELSNYRVSKGAWIYFDLKDDDSSVKFFGSVRQLPGPLEDGMQLEVFGRPYLHPRFGFSVQIMSLRPVGEGTIKKAQDLLFKKLEAEGLFAPERKRQLPYPPERIGLVTSAESAAISDFYKIITARWPKLQIELIDTLVQGISAPPSIVNAITEFNQRSDPPEVLVLIRGGGSADDLAAFSDESVVRAVAGSRVPTMVAIGHENDISLAELAADLRASTPSNAAELLVPDRTHESHKLLTIKKQMDQTLQGKYTALQNESAQYALAIDKAVRVRFADELARLARFAEILRLLDPGLPFKRGFALVRSEQNLIRSISQVKQGKQLNVEVSDGIFTAKVE